METRLKSFASFFDRQATTKSINEFTGWVSDPHFVSEPKNLRELAHSIGNEAIEKLKTIDLIKALKFFAYEDSKCEEFPFKEILLTKILNLFSSRELSGYDNVTRRYLANCCTRSNFPASQDKTTLNNAKRVLAAFHEKHHSILLKRSEIKEGEWFEVTDLQPGRLNHRYKQQKI
jgi:hypothetical protein